MKLFDAELSLMKVLWEEGEATAKRLSDIMKETVGWKKTTTYTMIKRCADKGAIERIAPNYLCRPLITIEDVREYETSELINKMYNGTANRLVASLLGGKRLSKDEIAELKQIVQNLE